MLGNTTTGRGTHRFLPVILLAFATGCDRPETSPVEPPVDAQQEESLGSVPAAVAPRGQQWDLDAEWAAIAREGVPGFAGYYRDSDSGEYIVATARPDRSEDAADFVRSRLADRVPGAPSVRAREVAFSWDELIAWRDELAPLLDGQAIIWLDMDEVRNKLVFGVADMSHGARIRAAATEAAIPVAAVEAVRSEPPTPRQQLSSHERPVIAGFRINWPSAGLTGCTLGVNVHRGMTSGFVTASHCSSHIFGLDGTIQHQSDEQLPAHRIGVESIDPPSYTTYWTWEGRASDAAFYAYDAGVSRTFGRIARTTFSQVNQRGSTQVDPSHPEFRITDKASNGAQVVNELVNKVGWRTGWTQGQITQTCVMVFYPTSQWGDFFMPCQWVASLFSWVGDSGAAIFQQNGPLEPDASHVSLWGILWGGPPGDSTTTYYSPISAVEQELGTLHVTCPPEPAPCHPPITLDLDGPNSIPQSGQYQWAAANVEGGDGSYTYTWYRRTNHVDSGSGCSYVSPWQQVGTAQSLQRWESAVGWRFELKVVVNSGGETASRSKLVWPSVLDQCPT